MPDVAPCRMRSRLRSNHDDLGWARRDVHDRPGRPRRLAAGHAALDAGVQTALDDLPPRRRVAREPVVVMRGAAPAGARIDVRPEPPATRPGREVRCELD